MAEGIVLDAHVNVVDNEVAGNGEESGTCMQSFDREENFEPVNEAYLVKSVLSPFEPLTPEKPGKAGWWQESAISYLSKGEMHIEEDAQVNKIFSDEVKELLAENKQSQLCATNSDKEGAEETDLKETPNPKPRKKRRRPKVIVEGQPKKTPKPASENPAFSSGTTKVKRKYVRRKGANNLNNTPLEGGKSETDSIETKRDTMDALTSQSSVTCSHSSIDSPIAQTTERTYLPSTIEKVTTAGVVPNRFINPTFVQLLQLA